MEGDKETLEQDSPKGSDIDLVDASVQRQEDPTTISKEDDQNQNPSSENGKSGTNEEDKSLVSPAEDQVMLDAYDDKAAVDGGKIDGAADVKVNEKPLESKSNGTDGRIEIHLEAPTTLDAVGYSTPVAQNKNVWLSDVEVLQMKTRRKFFFFGNLTNGGTSQNAMLLRFFMLNVQMSEADEWGTPQEQAAFMKELERFHREKALEFKPPKFYGEPLNCLK
jgi:hypothetical protein